MHPSSHFSQPATERNYTFLKFDIWLIQPTVVSMSSRLLSAFFITVFLVLARLKHTVDQNIFIEIAMRMYFIDKEPSDISFPL